MLNKLNKKKESLVLTLVQHWLQDLVNTGMSYSRISMRLCLSPSTIQKIVRQHRMPRNKTLHSIIKYYIKIFEAPKNYGVNTYAYYEKNEECIKQSIAKAKYVLMKLV